MINLRSAILGRKRYIFDQVIAGFIEKMPGREVNQKLAKLSFESLVMFECILAPPIT